MLLIITVKIIKRSCLIYSYSYGYFAAILNAKWIQLLSVLVVLFGFSGDKIGLHCIPPFRNLKLSEMYSWPRVPLNKFVRT
jgi:hypothetical protein